MPVPLHANSSITFQKASLLHKSPFHTDNRLTSDSQNGGFYCAFQHPLLYTNLFTTVSWHLLRTIFNNYWQILWSFVLISYSPQLQTSWSSQQKQ
jgi:hypothetical protein